MTCDLVIGSKVWGSDILSSGAKEHSTSMTNQISILLNRALWLATSILKKFLWNCGKNDSCKNASSSKDDFSIVYNLFISWMHLLWGHNCSVIRTTRVLLSERSWNDISKLLKWNLWLFLWPSWTSCKMWLLVSESSNFHSSASLILWLLWFCVNLFIVPVY